jgi:site-specific DNA-methyltransferase (adenine-specific)
MLIHGNNLNELPKLADASIDAIITDPPYELGFMGKTWDSTGIAYNTQLWRQCLRVLKPGGHLLAFSGSRTYHRMAVAIEDAGFEIRDQIMWVYGSGFPKSLDVSKAIDKAAGAERAVVGFSKGVTVSTDDNQHGGINRGAVGIKQTSIDVPITAPATDAAKQWEGWGTALKPAHEPIVLARKPLDGTVANNVLQHGTGALNINACRVHRQDGDDSHAGHRTATFGTQETLSGGDGSGGWSQNDAGRWPANLIHDGSEEVLQLFPDSKAGKPRDDRGPGGIWSESDGTPCGPQYGDSGSAARFFYCAKANKRDRNEGLDNFQPKRDADRNTDNGVGGNNPRNRTNTPKLNHHPTVKPTDLMRYLCRLITPPGGTILDPFTGSGSTGKAAILEGFNFIGIELDPDYITIAQARIDHAYTQRH